MKKKPSTTRRSWRDIPDSSHTRRFTSWPSPASLHPGPDVVEDAVAGSLTARAIIASYGRLPLQVTIWEVIA